MRFIEDAAGIRGREVIPRVIPVASPNAGSDWSVTVPGGVLWVPKSIFGIFTASAVAASRYVQSRVNDADGRILVNITPFASVTAGQIALLNWNSTVSSGYSSVFARQSLPIPMGQVLGGWSISVNTSNIDAGDQWGAIALYVLEIEERPYDVELARDYAALAGNRSNAYPEIREGL